MKILGIQFNDNETMENVMNELNRRGINPENRVIPILYAQEKTRIAVTNEFKLDAQSLIDNVKEEDYGN